MTLFFVTNAGVYVGGFDGVEPPSGSIEVPYAPDDARQIWNFTTGAWGPIPPLTEYTLPAVLPWNRMDENEAELVQDAIDASPVKTKNMINKATQFVTGTDAFTKLKNIVVATLDQTRADEIMGPPLASEMSAEDLV